jgi:hypothetical protein
MIFVCFYVLDRDFHFPTIVLRVRFAVVVTCSGGCAACLEDTLFASFNVVLLLTKNQSIYLLQPWLNLASFVVALPVEPGSFVLISILHTDTRAVIAGNTTTHREPAIGKRAIASNRRRNQHLAILHGRVTRSTGGTDYCVDR